MLYKDPFMVGTKIILPGGDHNPINNEGWERSSVGSDSVYTKVKSVKYMTSAQSLETVVATVERKWPGVKIVYPEGKSGPKRPDPYSWVAFVRRR